MENTNMKFYMIDEELLNTLVDLMLESIEMSSELPANSKDNVMYFTWLYDELLDLPQIKDAKKFASETKEKLLKNKTKDTLTDTEIKMLHYLNQVIKATNKSKSTTPKSKEAKKIIKEETSKIKNELIQKVPLKEIKQFLLDDPELTNEERFELYYQEHRRVQDEKNGNKEFNKMLKDLKIKPYNKGKS